MQNDQLSCLREREKITPGVVWRWVEFQNAPLVRKYPDEIAFLLAGFEAKRVADAYEAGDEDLAKRLEPEALRRLERADERKAELDGRSEQYHAATGLRTRGAREAAVGKILADPDQTCQGKELLKHASNAQRATDHAVFRAETREARRVCR